MIKAEHLHLKVSNKFLQVNPMAKHSRPNFFNTVILTVYNVKTVRNMYEISISTPGKNVQLAFSSPPLFPREICALVIHHFFNEGKYQVGTLFLLPQNQHFQSTPPLLISQVSRLTYVQLCISGFFLEKIVFCSIISSKPFPIWKNVCRSISKSVFCPKRKMSIFAYLDPFIFPC